jgi:hypothetical protein
MKYMKNDNISVSDCCNTDRKMCSNQIAGYYDVNGKILKQFWVIIMTANFVNPAILFFLCPGLLQQWFQQNLGCVSIERSLFRQPTLHLEKGEQEAYTR